MIPGNELILKCPYCQARKTIMSLISANSSGVIKWSDGYTVMPMYPQNSEIQQCSRCKKYFLINEQKQSRLCVIYELGTITIDIFTMAGSFRTISKRKTIKQRNGINHPLAYLVAS